VTVTATEPAVESSATPTPEWSPLPVPERLPTEPEVIFVVGVARSGTTMMRNILATSPRVAVARETHFMGHIFNRKGARHFFRQAGDLTNDDAVRKVVDLIYSGEYLRQSRFGNISPFWRWLDDSVPRAEFEKRLLAAERSERGLFTTLLRLYADAEGKPVMGEKTPTHLDYVDELLEWYPDGRIVHVLRDPRAIYVSDRYRREKMPRPPYSWMAKVPGMLPAYLLTLTVVQWSRALRRHDKYSAKYGDRYTLVKFEDSVQDPHGVLPPMFDFLGIQRPEDPTQVNVPAKHGMRDSSEGIDPQAADRWRERINPFAKRFLDLFLGGRMRKYGYTK
jgi:hypothetical protein